MNFDSFGNAGTVTSLPNNPPTAPSAPQVTSRLPPQSTHVPMVPNSAPSRNPIQNPIPSQNLNPTSGSGLNHNPVTNHRPPTQFDQIPESSPSVTTPEVKPIPPAQMPPQAVPQNPSAVSQPPVSITPTHSVPVPSPQPVTAQPVVTTPLAQNGRPSEVVQDSLPTQLSPQINFSTPQVDPVPASKLPVSVNSESPAEESESVNNVEKMEPEVHKPEIPEVVPQPEVVEENADAPDFSDSEDEEDQKSENEIDQITARLDEAENEKAAEIETKTEEPFTEEPSSVPTEEPVTEPDLLETKEDIVENEEDALEKAAREAEEAEDREEEERLELKHNKMI